MPIDRVAKTMPSPISPATPARAPAPVADPRRVEPKYEPYDTGPWYLGRQAFRRALESDKKR